MQDALPINPRIPPPVSDSTLRIRSIRECWSRKDKSSCSLNWGACEPSYTWGIELIQDRIREFRKFRNSSRSYMIRNGHWDRILYHFPWSSVIFHDLPWPSMTFQCTAMSFYEVLLIGMQACGDFMIMIGRHGRSVHDLYLHFCGAMAMPTSLSTFCHHLELDN